jgi:hypothetical protein
MKIRTPFSAAGSLALVSVLLTGCGGVSVASLWPFGGEGSLERSRVPPNSTAYQCEGGKRFYLRYLDNGAAAWVILPEREFRLDKIPGDGSGRFGSGRAVLTVGDGEASLSDGPTVSYAGCRIPSAEPPKPVAKPADPPASKPAAKP